MLAVSPFIRTGTAPVPEQDGKVNGQAARGWHVREAGLLSWSSAAPKTQDVAVNGTGKQRHR